MTRFRIKKGSDSFKDITKSYQKFAKEHSQLSEEIASLKSIIEPEYIQSKIQEAVDKWTDIKRDFINYPRKTTQDIKLL